MWVPDQPVNTANLRPTTGTKAYSKKTKNKKTLGLEILIKNSAVKTTCCFCWGPGSGSRHTHVTKALHTCGTQTYMQAKCAHKVKNLLNFLKKFLWVGMWLRVKHETLSTSQSSGTRSTSDMEAHICDLSAQTAGSEAETVWESQKPPGQLVLHPQQ